MNVIHFILYMYIFHVCREKKHFPFIWNMSLEVLFINYFRNMGPSKSLLSKIILGRLSLDFPIYMQEIQCIGNFIILYLLLKIGASWLSFKLFICFYLHRDIKGANILVDPNGEIKLADFGMAKHVSLSCMFVSG